MMSPLSDTSRVKVGGKCDFFECQPVVQNSRDEKLDLHACATTYDSNSPLSLDERASFSPNAITLRFKTLRSYCQRMGTLLFLEEELNLEAGQSLLLASKNFSVEQLKDTKVKYKGYMLNLLVTPSLCTRFQLVATETGESPTEPNLNGQMVILVLDNDEFRFGYMLHVPNLRSLLQENQNISVCVRFYSWSLSLLPEKLESSDLKILFASSQANGMFKAISRFSKSSFLKFLLGRSEIKQEKPKPIIQPSNDWFNDSQRIAVKSVLQNSITVIKGPPGSGKTKTIHEMILQLLRKKTFPIVVVAASNVAIDNIAEKMILKHSSIILRLTAVSKESQYEEGHPLALICLHTKFYNASSPEIQCMVKRARSFLSSVTREEYKKIKKAKGKFLRHELLQRKVIFTTSVAAASLHFFGRAPKFSVVIMDEATQLSEPATLVPLVLVGDQKQLSCTSDVKALSLSLFERVLRNRSFKSPRMLDTQYRMHPAISKFPRQSFYNGQLKDGVTACDRKWKGVPNNPVLLWDTGGKCREEAVFINTDENSHRTISNMGEARYVERVLSNLIREKNIRRSSIGVITTYRGQRDQICSLLMQNKLINPKNGSAKAEIDCEEFSDESKNSTIQYVYGLMLSSVDAFQGREKDFIVMSCVRSNTKNEVGFMRDCRRLNVALTRARYGLIIIGDLKCLRSESRLWETFAKFLNESGTILKASKFRNRFPQLWVCYKRCIWI